MIWRFVTTVIFFTLLAFFAEGAWAVDDWLCEKLKLKECPKGNHNSRATGASYPQTTDSFKFNPSALPVDRGFGVETITWKGEYDVGIVTGTGRIGAGISPNSSEEKFFGNIGFQNDTDYEDRVVNEQKLQGKKMAVAAAVRLIGKSNSSGLKFNLGALGKYNKKTKKATPGGGASVEYGPISLGFAHAKDMYYDEQTLETIKYDINTYSVGLKLGYLALDWSKADYELPNSNGADLHIISATVFYKRWMFTWGNRIENSDRRKYDRQSGQFLDRRKATETFLGAQIGLNDHLVIGLFQNYYLFGEWSVGVSIFF